jgi:tetratricopeptide (TPR) repeat protein
LPWRTVVLTWPSLLWFDIKQLLLPVKLSIFYDTPYITAVSLESFWLPLLAIAIVGLLCSWLARKQKALVGFAVAWFLLTLLPTFNLRVFRWRDFAHDRYLYLPSIAFVIILALAVRRLPETPWKRVGLPASQLITLLVLFFAISVNTVLETAPWGSNLFLLTRATQVAPRNVAAAYMLGAELMGRGQLPASSEMFARATRLAPNWAAAWSSLGIAEYRQHHYQEAHSAFVRAATLAPEDKTVAELLRLSERGL